MKLLFDENLSMIKVRLRIIVEPDSEGFYAYCPELVGLHVDGATEEEAFKNASDAAMAYLNSLIKHNDPLPIGTQQISVGALIREKVSSYLGKTRSRTAEICLQA